VGICGGKYLCKENIFDKCDCYRYNLDDYLEFFVTNYEKYPELFLIEL
jgi:hypothetical protein